MPPILEIAFHRIDHSDTLEALIRAKAAKLEQVSDRLASIRAVVEYMHKSKTQGNPCRVRLDLTVAPGHEFAVEREADVQRDPAVEIAAIVRDAFQAARRILQKHEEKQRGEVKAHPGQEVGAVVVRLFPDLDYGFLRTPEGEEVYFHRNAVAGNAFDALRVGTGVAFEAEEGEKGPQATSVRVVDQPSE